MPCVEGAPDCLASGWTANEFFAKLAVWSLGALVYTYASSKVLPRTDFNGSPKRGGREGTSARRRGAESEQTNGRTAAGRVETFPGS